MVNLLSDHFFPFIISLFFQKVKKKLSYINSKGIYAPNWRFNLRDEWIGQILIDFEAIWTKSIRKLISTPCWRRFFRFLPHRSIKWLAICRYILRQTLQAFTAIWGKNLKMCRGRAIIKIILHQLPKISYFFIKYSLPVKNSIFFINSSLFTAKLSFLAGLKYV